MISVSLLGLGGCKAPVFAVEPPEEDSPAPADTNEPAETVEPTMVLRPPVISKEPQEDEQPPTPEQTEAAASADGPDVPLQERAEDGFFEDAAFTGNSLMDGFRLFSGLSTCDYYAATSMTVAGATSSLSFPLENGNLGTMVDGLSQKPYGKIYILLGINEIWMSADNFAKLYGEMLDAIIAAQPDSDIYIMGITPVSAAKSLSDDNINMTKINEYNEHLYKLAEEKGCYFLDLVAALADDTGFLPAEETSDGVHFSANLYNQWVEYVRTHYITE
jgi:hypothetical protein